MTYTTSQKRALIRFIGFLAVFFTVWVGVMVLGLRMFDVQPVPPAPIEQLSPLPDTAPLGTVN